MTRIREYDLIILALEVAATRPDMCDYLIRFSLYQQTSGVRQKCAGVQTEEQQTPERPGEGFVDLRLRVSAGDGLEGDSSASLSPEPVTPFKRVLGHKRQAYPASPDRTRQMRL
jgi:hypothetical protein